VPTDGGRRAWKRRPVRAAAVAGIAGATLLAAGLLAVSATGGRHDAVGPGSATARGVAPGRTLGDHSDAVGLGQAVERALRSGGHAVPEEGAPCAEATAAYRRGLGPLRLAASLRWQGVPAVVFAYPVGGGPSPSPIGYRALVLARDDCRLLLAQGL
jgi:hypothetical protein